MDNKTSLKKRHSLSTVQSIISLALLLLDVFGIVAFLFIRIVGGAFDLFFSFWSYNAYSFFGSSRYFFMALFGLFMLFAVMFASLVFAIIALTNNKKNVLAIVMCALSGGFSLINFGSIGVMVVFALYFDTFLKSNYIFNYFLQ